MRNARMMELAYMQDLKSCGLTALRVRTPLRVLTFSPLSSMVERFTCNEKMLVRFRQEAQNNNNMEKIFVVDFIGNYIKPYTLITETQETLVLKSDYGVFTYKKNPLKYSFHFNLDEAKSTLAEHHSLMGNEKAIENILIID